MFRSPSRPFLIIALLRSLTLFYKSKLHPSYTQLQDFLTVCDTVVHCYEISLFLNCLHREFNETETVGCRKVLFVFIDDLSIKELSQLFCKFIVIRFLIYTLLWYACVTVLLLMIQFRKQWMFN